MAEILNTHRTICLERPIILSFSNLTSNYTFNPWLFILWRILLLIHYNPSNLKCFRERGTFVVQNNNFKMLLFICCYVLLAVILTFAIQFKHFLTAIKIIVLYFFKPITPTKYPNSVALNTQPRLPQLTIHNSFRIICMGCTDTKHIVIL